jgi:hypothetical protein
MIQILGRSTGQCPIAGNDLGHGQIDMACPISIVALPQGTCLSVPVRFPYPSTKDGTSSLYFDLVKVFESADQRRVN